MFRELFHEEPRFKLANTKPPCKVHVRKQPLYSGRFNIKSTEKCSEHPEWPGLRDGSRRAEGYITELQGIKASKPKRLEGSQEVQLPQVAAVCTALVSIYKTAKGALGIAHVIVGLVCPYSAMVHGMCLQLTV